MEIENALQQKTFIAEKQIAYVRGIVIVFSSLAFFLLENARINYPLSYILLAFIYIYGAFVIFFKPYEKYPVFLASWFTLVSDSVFTTLWLYATGGFESPYHVIYYTSVIAVAFRFGINTTLFTAGLYTVLYFGIVYFMDQLQGNEAIVLIRAGFIFIIGYLTTFITRETLHQTEQKFLLKKLVSEAEASRAQIEANSKELAELNQELKVRNDIFKHAEENAEIGSYFWSLHDNRIHYSDNLFRLLGCKPGEFTPSVEKYLEYVHPSEKDLAIKNNKEAFEKREFKPSVRKMQLKNNEIRYFRASGRFIENGGRELLIGTVQDVTSDVLLREAVNAKNAELENSNNELSSFNYIASHDLQEPVRKIHTFSNLILQREKDSLSPGTKDYLERIMGSAGRMQRLIEAFSNYSRIGTSKIKFETIDLNKMVEEAKNNLGEKVTENHSSVEYHDLPTIVASPFHMQQLFENLLSNAIKYRKAEVPPVISIKAELVSLSTTTGEKITAASDYWKITVKDNGIGFQQQYAEKIFEVFQRLHSKEQYPGTGIGLAICKKIALIHKGSIEASSIPGEGSEFRILIPKEGLEDSARTDAQ